MNKQVSATKIYITYTNITIYHLFYDFFQKPLCISLNYFNHHERFKTNANVKLTKSSQPLRYRIYCIVRRALKLITEQLQYGIYCIAIVVLKLWATTIRNLLHRHVVPNYTISQLHAELSASQRSAYTFYETEQLRTEFSASSRSANFSLL